MAIVDSETYLSGLSQVGREAALERAGEAQILLDNRVDTGFLSTLGAAFRSENSAIALTAAASSMQKPQAVQGYNPFRDDDLENYAPWLKQFITSRSPEETSLIKSQIDRENRDREIIQSSPYGLAASLAAGFLDPINLLPVAGAAGKAGLLFKAGVGASAAEFAVAGALGGAASEIALQTATRTRTAEESLYNIAGSTILSAVLGAAVGKLSPEAKAAYSDIIEKEIREGDILEQVNREVAPNFAGVPSDYDVWEHKFASISSEDTKLAYRGKVSKWLFENLRTFMSPKVRAQTSIFDDVRSSAMMMLDSSGLPTQANVKGITAGPSVESAIKHWQVQSATARRERVIAYEEYAIAAKKQGVEPLAEGAFNAEVGKALENADEPLAVDELSKGYLKRAISAHRQKVFDPMLNDAQAVGFLAKDIDLKGAKSYYPFWIPSENVVKDPNGFLERAAVGYERSGLDKAAAREQALKLRENYLGQREGEMPFSGIGEPGVWKDRVLPQEVREALTDYREWDIDRVTDHYVNTTAGRLELSRRFRRVPDGKVAELSDLLGAMRNAAKTGKADVLDLAEGANIRAAALKASRITEDAKSAERIDGLLTDRDILSGKIKGIETRIQTAKAVGEDVKEIQAGLDPLKAKLGENTAALEKEIRASAEVDQGYRDRLSVVSKLRKSLESSAEGVPTQQAMDEIITAMERDLSDLRNKEAVDGMNMRGVFNSVKRDFNEKLAKATSEKEIAKLKKAYDQDVEVMGALRDRLIGTYGLPANPQDIPFRISQALKRISFIKTAGMFLPSQITDLGNMIFATSLRDFGSVLGSFAKSPSEFKAGSTELARGLMSAELYSVGKRHHLWSSIRDDVARLSKFERGLQWGQEASAKVFLLDRWNSGWTYLATNMVEMNMTRAIKKLATGKASPEDIRNLAMAGIDFKSAGRIWLQMEKAAEKEVGYNTSRLLPRTDIWEDVAAKRIFEQSVIEQTGRAMIRPGAGDLYLWMSEQFLSMLGAYKSFAQATTNKILLSGLLRQDMAALNGIMAGVGLGVVSYGMHQILVGKPISDDPGTIIAEAVDRSGVLGSLMEANNILERATMGKVGINPMLGGEGASRYASRSVMDALLGAPLGVVSDTGEIAQSFFKKGEFTQGDLNRIRRMLPLQNLFYVRRLLDQFAAGTGQAFGLPDRGGFRTQVETRPFAEIGATP